MKDAFDLWREWAEKAARGAAMKIKTLLTATARRSAIKQRWLGVRLMQRRIAHLDLGED